MNTTLSKMYVFIVLLALGACKKDDETLQHPVGFSVEITQNVELPYAVTSKDEIVFDIKINSKADVNIQQAILRLDDTELHTASATANEIHIQYTYPVTSRDVGKSLIFLLTVLDAEGRSVDRDFTVYIQSAPPDITVTIPETAPSEIKADENADFTVSVVSENDLRYVKTFLDETEITSLTKEIFDNPKSDDYHFEYLPTAADAGKTLVFTIEVMDVLGNIVKQEYTLGITRSQQVDFNFYSDVHLGAQFSTNHGPFFNASTGEVYVTAGAAAKSANIDLVTFYSGSTFAYNVVSPTLQSVADFTYTEARFGADAIKNWSVRNRTLIKKITLTRADFDLVVSAAEIEALYTNSSVTESETSGGLANNNAIVFKTATGKYGVLYVKSRSANSGEGHLIVDIKVQK